MNLINSITIYLLDRPLHHDSANEHLLSLAARSLPNDRLRERCLPTVSDLHSLQGNLFLHWQTPRGFQSCHSHHTQGGLRLQEQERLQIVYQTGQN